MDNTCPSPPWQEQPFARIWAETDPRTAKEEVSKVMRDPTTAIYIDASAKDGNLGAAVVMLDANDTVCRARQIATSLAQRKVTKADTLRDWSIEWNRSVKGQYLRKIDEAAPGPHVRKLYDHLPRQRAGLLAQLRIGHNWLQCFSKRMNFSDSDRCECGAVETVVHVFIDCPKLREPRRQLREAIGDRFNNLAAMLGDRTQRRSKITAKELNAVLDFAEKSGRFRKRDTELDSMNAGRLRDGYPYTDQLLLYEGWEPLDVIGPYEIIMNLSYFHNITLSLISDAIGPVTTQPMQPPNSPLAAHNHMIPLSAIATHTYSTAPKLDILLVPGGVGLDIRAAANDTTLERFVSSRYDELQYLVSVCTGARVLAGSGVLNGKRATTNKSAWGFVTAKWGWGKYKLGAECEVDDGWEGMDLTYAFMKFLYGNETVDKVMGIIEYAPHTNPDWDPFSVMYKVPGVNMSMDLKDCAGPVGI
ncbi:hypothetical protein G7Y89_g13137 [Cudoniella acicularis]|uniref:DJ-1/PfpI domain-containing protein n=1 Tax=Cudoniella acicularis TaxID=354080 RepID=A0A8H4VWQ2_9HELO|nr:hypothetical protein G7Y89_g13137 [Cudoniella acicularis]